MARKSNTVAALLFIGLGAFLTIRLLDVPPVHLEDGGPSSAPLKGKLDPEVDSPERSAARTQRRNGSETPDASGGNPPSTDGTGPPKEAPELHVRVVDGLGRAVPDATIFLAVSRRSDLFASPEDYLLNLPSARRHAQTTGRFHAGDIGRTNEDGWTVFETPHPEADKLVAWHEELGSVFATREATVREVQLVLLRQPRLFGSVRETVGGAIHDAEIACYRVGRAMPVCHVRSGADGDYSSPPLPPGTYLLQATHDAHISSATEERALVPGGPGARVDFRLEPRIEVRWRLVDESGSAWTRTRLEALGWDFESAEVWVSSRFECAHSELEIGFGERLAFDGSTGEAHEHLEHPGQRVSLWIRERRLAEGDAPQGRREGNVVLTIAPNRTELELDLLVRYATSEDTPPETRVEIGTWSGVLFETWRTRVRAKGAQERFVLQIPGELRGSTATLLLVANDHAEQLEPIEIPSTGWRFHHESTLASSAPAIQGTILDAAGEPAPGAIVTLTDLRGLFVATPSSSRRVADPRGRFVFEEVVRREYLLLARDRNGSTAAQRIITSETPLDDLDMRLRESREIEVKTPKAGSAQFRVLDANGTPLDSDRPFGAVRNGSRFRVAIPPLAESLHIHHPGDPKPWASISPIPPQTWAPPEPERQKDGPR